jgi:DNA-binding PadR family transcriptional regulator
MNPNVIQSWLDFLILNAFTAGPVCSSDIEQRIGQKMRLFFEVDSASVLKTLQRLESAGWLVSEWREKEDSKSEKVYSITGAGKEHLVGEWQMRKSSLAQFMDEGKWPAFLSQKADSRN